MIFFESLMVALSTYSVIPMPQFQWNERNMKYALCFFPAVGICIGAVYLIWYHICLQLSVSGILFAAVGTALPILISGGIHMDGFMDTVDALSSHREREKKLEILKDPNCGAFAVAYCGVYLLLFFGLLYECYSKSCAGILGFGFILSRCLSGILAINMKNARGSGMLYAFTAGSERKTATAVLTLLGVLTAAVMLLMKPPVFCLALIAGGIWCLKYKSLAMKQFGGATGDTAGFFLQIFELSFLFGIWLGALIL